MVRVIIHIMGIFGFSPGGRLALTCATHYQKSYIENSNNTGLRPAFQILIYAFISMQNSFTNTGLKTKILGTPPTKDDINLFSNELLVNKNIPPAYIKHIADNNTADVDISIEYSEKLKKIMFLLRCTFILKADMVSLLSIQNG